MHIYILCIYIHYLYIFYVYICTKHNTCICIYIIYACIFSILKYMQFVHTHIRRVMDEWASTRAAFLDAIAVQVKKLDRDQTSSM